MRLGVRLVVRLVVRLGEGGFGQGWCRHRLGLHLAHPAILHHAELDRLGGGSGGRRRADRLGDPLQGAAHVDEGVARAADVAC